MVGLVVNDGELDSEPTYLILRTTNRLPVANAGPDRSVQVGETVLVQGDQSYDPDGDLLTYDDDSGGDMDAWIEYFILPADGSYTIISSDIAGEAGTYELTLEMAHLEVEGVLIMSICLNIILIFNNVNEMKYLI